MIKKLIGIIIAVAVVAIIVLTVMHRNNYSSMLLRDGDLNQTPLATTATTTGGTMSAAPAPTTAEIAISDSVTIEVVDTER